MAALRQELEESREKFDDVTKQHHLDVAKIKRINEEKLEKLEQELEAVKSLNETSKRQFATEREIEIQEQASLKVSLKLYTSKYGKILPITAYSDRAIKVRKLCDASLMLKFWTRSSNKSFCSKIQLHLEQVYEVQIVSLLFDGQKEHH